MSVQLTLPGHNYLGPGNPTYNGSPVDVDDAIAQVHDEEYSKATSSKDIRISDRKAIKAFGKDTLTHGNTHSLLGASGLGIKYLTESVTGVLYPSISGKTIKTTSRR